MLFLQIRIFVWFEIYLKILSTSYYKIKYSNDLKGVAACGGIKNIYAMIVGTSMGINAKNEKIIKILTLLLLYLSVSKRNVLFY